MSQISPQPSPQPINAQTATVRRLRRLSYLMDEVIRIPGTPFRIGLDPLIDLLPVGGDFVGTALSAYIVWEAARLGVPRSLLTQMAFNILVDTVVGIVPVLGSVVDATWKANVKNLVLLEEHLAIPHPQPKKKVDRWFLALLLGGLLLMVVIVAAIGVILLRWVWTLING